MLTHLFSRDTQLLEELHILAVDIERQQRIPRLEIRVAGLKLSSLHLRFRCSALT